MSELFTAVLRMSLTSCYVIAVVLLARLALIRAPKVFSYALWSVVLFRLVCPISFAGKLSLMPGGTAAAELGAAVAAGGAEAATGAVVAGAAAQAGSASAGLAGGAVGILGLIWLAGALAMLAAGVISALRLERRLAGAQPAGGAYVAEGLKTPFVMGILHPRIYLPAGLSGEQADCILRHERAHIRRCDHAAKPLAFAVLCLHWFDPLVWLAFALMARDMEMACDERVMRELGGSAAAKKSYCSAMLALASGGRAGGAAIAFGGGKVKRRVKNVLNYKKPALWVIAVCALAVVGLCVGLAVNRMGAQAITEIEFPAYQDGKNQYNAYIYEAGPFTLSVELPGGWRAVLPEERGFDGQGTPVNFADGEGSTVGMAFYGVFDNIEGVPQESYYQVAFQGLRGGSMVSWCENYAPVCATDTFESATAAVYVNNMYLDPTAYTAAAAAGYVEYPSAVAYDKQLGMYVAMRFEPDSVSADELAAIARSIQLRAAQ